MKEAVQLLKKKKFITWFLRKHRLKTPDAVRILEFIADNDALLQATHFVENVRHLPSAIIISAEEAPTVSFLCRINDNYYENIDEILNCLEFDPPEELFIWLSFDREFMCNMCDVVLGAKPGIDEKIFYHRVIKDLERELNFTVRDMGERKKILLSEIDEALEQGDKDRFMALTELYKELID